MSELGWYRSFVLTSFLFCMRAISVARIAVQGLSCSVANDSGSNQLKLVWMALNMWFLQIKISSHVAMGSYSFGSRCLHALRRFFRSGVVWLLEWRDVSTIICPDSRSSTSWWKDSRSCR